MPGDLSLVAIAPELALTIGVLAVLIAEVTLEPEPHDRRLLLRGVTAGTLGLAVLACAWEWVALLDGGAGPAYAGMIVMDGYAVLAKSVLLGLAILALVAAWPMVEDLGREGAELLALVLVSLAGMMLMASSLNLVMLFLALEVASISLYVVAGMGPARVEGEEAAMKYFLLGSFASAIFLYGTALTYAATGELSLAAVGELLSGAVLTRPGILMAGVGLLLVGMGFKVSAAPFHMWSPDVYQGAPAGAVGFMAAGAKVAGFAALARVLVQGFGALNGEWAPAVAVVAALSVVLGTVLAIAQNDIRRMLAYSSVAHAGFVMTPLVAGGEGLTSFWFYLATYGVQLVAAFTIVALVAGPMGGRSALADYTGLSERAPFLAGVMAFMMLAMAGIPLTSGFVGKVAVFASALGAGYLWLVILGLVAAVAGFFFYLRLIVLMYMQSYAEAPGAARAQPRAQGAVRMALSLSVAFTLVFGIVPGPLLELIRGALGL